MRLVEHVGAAKAEADHACERSADRHRQRAQDAGGAEGWLDDARCAARVAADARRPTVGAVHLLARGVDALPPLDVGHAEVGRGPTDVDAKVRAVVGDVGDAELVDGNDAANLVAGRGEGAAVEQRR